MADMSSFACWHPRQTDSHSGSKQQHSEQGWHDWVPLTQPLTLNLNPETQLINLSMQAQEAQGHQADALRPAPVPRPGSIRRQ